MECTAEIVATLDDDISNSARSSRQRFAPFPPARFMLSRASCQNQAINDVEILSDMLKKSDASLSQLHRLIHVPPSSCIILISPILEAARASYAQVEITDNLRGVKVSEVMADDWPVVDGPDAS